MTTAIQQMTGLVNAFTASPTITNEVNALATSTNYGVTTYTSSIINRLRQSIAQYDQAALGDSPADTVGWVQAYTAAYSAADLASRWAYGTATLSSPGPSPSSPTAFSTSGSAYDALLAQCSAAEAAALAPTNSLPAMPDLAAAVVAASKAITTAWGSGEPTPSPSLVASFAAIIAEGEGIAGALGITWAPAA